MDPQICNYTGKEIIKKHEPTEWFRQFYLTLNNIVVTQYREGVVLSMDHAREYTRLLADLSGETRSNLLIDTRPLSSTMPEVYEYFWSSDYNSYYRYAALLIPESPLDETLKKFILQDTLPPARFMIFRDSGDIVERAVKWLNKKLNEEIYHKTRAFYNSGNEIHWQVLAGLLCFRSLEEIAEKNKIPIKVLEDVDLENFTLEHFGTTYIRDVSRHIESIPALENIINEKVLIYLDNP